MRSFSELLTEYTARVGISDAELARALGVRRQTVFRWKEGLTERPRHREDVVRCAQKLRLTPDERDELLLAAGFAPERPVALAPAAPLQADEASTHAPAGTPRPPPDGPASPAAVPRPAGEAPITATSAAPGTAARAGGAPTAGRPVGPASPAGAPAAAPPETTGGAAAARRPVAARRGVLRAAVPLLLLAVLAVGLYALLRPGAGAARPRATAGETLVVVGPFDAPAGALRAAVEREARAARLERVRVEAWPDPVADAAAASRARADAAASVALGGAREGARLRLALAAAPPAWRAEDGGLAALVADPTESAFPIASESPEEAQAAALLVLAHLLTERGDPERARAVVTRALAVPPAAPEAVAALHLAAGYAAQARPGADLGEAIAAYDESIAAADGPVARLNRGVAQLRLGRSDGWRADLPRAEQLRPGWPLAQRALCWAHALDRELAAALPRCDAAVAAEGDRAREARAVAYAGLGRLEDAARDLERYLAWLDGQPARARYAASRGEWLSALRAGRDPFDEATLEAIRRE